MLKHTKQQRRIVKALIILVVVPLTTYLLTAFVKNTDSSFIYFIIGVILSLMFIQFYDTYGNPNTGEVTSRLDKIDFEINSIRLELSEIKSIISFKEGKPFREVYNSVVNEQISQSIKQLEEDTHEGNEY